MYCFFDRFYLELFSALEYRLTKVLLHVLLKECL